MPLIFLKPSSSIASSRKSRIFNLFRHVSGSFSLPQTCCSSSRGVLYGSNGKISQHAKFEEVPLNLSQMATAVGAQIMLVSIAMQLNRIEAAIVGISEELHDDRIAQVNAGILQYETAMQMISKSYRDAAIQNAIQSLTEGLSSVRLELRRRIADLPDSTNKFSDNWLKSKACLASEKLQVAEEALMVSIRGASVLAQCYAALDEPHVGVYALSHCLQDLEACGVAKAAETARIVEVKRFSVLPETPWLQFREAHHHFLQEEVRGCLSTSQTEQRDIAIEFTRNELLERI